MVTLPRVEGQLIERRIEALFGEAGVAVPWSLLRALSNVDDEHTRRYRDGIATLATRHRSGSVRRSATQLLERLDK